jgi:hypothetical protein
MLWRVGSTMRARLMENMSVMDHFSAVVSLHIELPKPPRGCFGATMLSMLRMGSSRLLTQSLSALLTLHLLAFTYRGSSYIEMSAIPNVLQSLHAQRESPHDAAQACLLRNKKATADHLERVDSKTTNGVYNKAAPQWSVHDSPIENQRSIKVIVIGAGYSGIYLGIRLPERLRNCELVIYEKNKGVGGAWYVGHLCLYPKDRY